MSINNLIALNELCVHYKVETSFFKNLNDIGLIEIHTIKETLYIDQQKLNDLEKMMRLHHDLEVNMEGIDVVFNLLQKVFDLEAELNKVKKRLLLYEEGPE
ncbi:MAG: chaperone modulator CbpM [Saprospiraceae bacterium]|nr:chaperone modulator CbpM [Saprospiraceae bacterium]